MQAAQIGEEHPTAKALRGFGGRSVLEIVSDYKTDTWRAVYTVRLGDVVYVLHAFQQKSKKGVATPQKEIDLVWKRVAAATLDYEERQKDDSKKGR